MVLTETDYKRQTWKHWHIYSSSTVRDVIPLNIWKQSFLILYLTQRHTYIAIIMSERILFCNTKIIHQKADTKRKLNNKYDQQNIALSGSISVSRQLLNRKQPIFSVRDVWKRKNGIVLVHVFMNIYNLISRGYFDWAGLNCSLPVKSCVARLIEASYSYIYKDSLVLC